MDERLKFVARHLEGEKMAVLCRDFGISRKTGYKILERYEDTGVEGLTDRSRRARSLPDKGSASSRSRTGFGSSALTWDTSMTRNADWNRSTTHLDQNCYPCLRNKLLPMSQEGHREKQPAAAGARA
jgi:Helix-turn-helix domain